MPQPQQTDEDLVALVPLESDSPALKAAIIDYRRRMGSDAFDVPVPRTKKAYDPPRK